MEKISFDYSMKNIPIPPQSSYMKNLIEKVEKFVKRIRWKAYFFEHPSEKTVNENFGFMSNKTPPQNERKVLTHLKMISMNLSRTLNSKALKINSNRNLMVI